MKLATYIAHKGLTNGQFAKLAGLSEGTVSLLCRDQVWLSPLTAVKIAKATSGKVTVADFDLERVLEELQKRRKREKEPALRRRRTKKPEE